jgi:hypothetical protein
MTIFSRVWAMPNCDMFSIPPIKDLLRRYCGYRNAKRVVDPFARNSDFAEWSNDLNPATSAKYHMDAVAFLEMLVEQGERFDVVLLDPPYSPRQVSEMYQSIGREVTQIDTQVSPMINQVRTNLDKLLVDDGIAIRCGWSSMGIGDGRGYQLVEVLLVPHGGMHVDTIVTVERKRSMTIGWD